GTSARMEASGEMLSGIAALSPGRLSRVWRSRKTTTTRQHVPHGGVAGLVAVADPLGVGGVHLGGDLACTVPQLPHSEPVSLRCRDPVPGSSVLGHNLLGQLPACGRDCSSCPARSCPGGVNGGAHAAPPPPAVSSASAAVA